MKANKTTAGLSIQPELLAVVRAAAAKEDLNFSQFVCRLLKARLAKNGKGKK